MLDFKKVEQDMLEFWKENKIYEKSKKKNSKGKKFYFLDGPPFTSGRLHIGHAWNNSMKDIAMRFFRLNGYNVWDRAGYDMHGLPTENKVQKELNLADKQAIEKYGLDKFAKKCYEFSYNNALQMNEDLKRLGIWMDFDNAYMPIKNEFMGAEWLLIKEAFNQKRLYKGTKVMQWCGNCETSLAKHELEYENVKENSIFLKFKVKGKKDEFIIIWTTTPWTIPFNLAVMVNPDIDYVKAEVETGKGKEKWIVAKALAGIFITGLLEFKFKILDEFKGKNIEGLEYEHPLHNQLKKIYDEEKKKSKKVHTIILSKDYVDTSAGSGLVHCAPGCGPEDYEVAKQYGIDALNTLDEKGVFQDMGEFNGMIAKRDDKKFVEALKKAGSLVAETKIEHEYAHCWRCHNPVIFRTTEQWFMKTEDLIKKILDYNKKINWVPKSVQNSYEAWISNLKDNGITRQRYWGTPVPLWKCECGEIEVIGGIDELKKKAINNIPIDLHKPWIDKVLLKCPKCKKEMHRIPDVLDVWLDSGTVSWNCLNYPQDKKNFEKFFPADLIIEASEQARLWFSMLQICSTIVLKKSCYDGVYGHGMILDFQGTKMSKSLGNIISPYEVIDKYSSEILRYYICETKAGENINFNWEDVKQKQRNLIVLMNTANYLAQLENKKDNKKLEIEEKYLFSKLNSSMQKITKLFENYSFDKTITEIENLFLDISRVYIKMTRDKSSENSSLVFSALKEAYVKTIQMFSTICPLLSEYIWQQLRKDGIVKEESVHLCEWPKADAKKIDIKLEEEFEKAMKAIEAGMAARDAAKIGLRWPLASAKIRGYLTSNKELKEIIGKQLNVKEIFLEKGKELKVELDLEMTPELEAEGFSREFARKVQAERKNAGLQKIDEIEIEIFTDDKMKKMLKVNEEFIKNRINAKKIEFSNERDAEKGAIVFTVKDKNIKFIFSKVPPQ
ncbi:MAG: isoleucine--tRNA ligase [archaeon]|nr:isoleucine--tRNA ligase [archaeon]